MGNLLSNNKEEKQDGEMANRKEVRDNHVIREEITLTEQEMIMWVPAESEGDKEMIQERCMLNSPGLHFHYSNYIKPCSLWEQGLCDESWHRQEVQQYKHLSVTIHYGRVNVLLQNNVSVNVLKDEGRCISYS